MLRTGHVPISRSFLGFFRFPLPQQGELVVFSANCGTMSALNVPPFFAIGFSREHRVLVSVVVFPVSFRASPAFSSHSSDKRFFLSRCCFCRCSCERTRKRSRNLFYRLFIVFLSFFCDVYAISSRCLYDIPAISRPVFRNFCFSVRDAMK